MEKIKLITIIVPVFNEEDTINSFLCAVDKVIKEKINHDKYNFQYLFVDDGSKDKTREILQSLKREDVKYISFSRNFGKESALLAGLKGAIKLDTDAAILMDVDLQDPPEIIPQMLEKYEEGYLHITTKHKVQHSDSLFMKLCTKSFYKLFSFFTGFKSIKKGSRDYAFLDRKVVEAYASYEDSERFTKGISEDVGFKSTCIEFDFVNRSEGKTKWNYSKLIKYAFVGINAFSTWYNIIVNLLMFLCFGFGVFDVIYVCLNSLNIFEYAGIRFDLFGILVCIIAKLLFKLIYRNKTLLLNRKPYFIEDSNF